MSGPNIVVTVKQVPDTHNVTSKAMKDDGTVNRAELPTIFNPEDLNALEEALRIKDQLGGRVTAITMGPPKAQEILKDCLYRGVDEVVLISDMKFAGADTLATSYALKCAIEKIGKFDIIVCGRQAIDGDTAQVGPQIAEKLGINQISSISKVLNVNNEMILVERATEYGIEVLKSNYPVLLTVVGEANEPRFPNVKKLMQYKDLSIENDPEKIIKRWDTGSINADITMCGLKGSPTKVKKIEQVVLTASEAKSVTNSNDGIANLIGELTEEYIIG